MPRFHWTPETFGFALRDSRGYARCIIAHNKKRAEYRGQVLTRDLPASEPYSHPRGAAAWVARMAIKRGHLPLDSEFGALP